MKSFYQNFNPMRNLILFLFFFHLTTVAAFSQEEQEGYSVNQNAFKAKVYLSDESKEKGLLYRIDQDSILLAEYEQRNSKTPVKILSYKSLSIQSIQLIKTQDRELVRKAIGKGAKVGAIPGAVFGIFLIAGFPDEPESTVPLALGFTALGLGIGALIGNAIGPDYEKFPIDNSLANFEQVRIELEKRAYLSKMDR